MNECPFAIVVAALIGPQGDSYEVHILPAGECTITYRGDRLRVFWSRPGNYLTSKQERDQNRKGGEHWKDLQCDIEFGIKALPWDEAVQYADELRGRLDESGRMATS